MSEQLDLDFDACEEPAAPKTAARRWPTDKMFAEAKAVAERQAAWLERANDEARDYWRIGMVTSLPLFCQIQGTKRGNYTQMLPGVVESITDDTATVRIYAAPAWGFTIEHYPLHLKLAIDIPLRDLGKHHGNVELQRLVDDGRLATGCEVIAEAMRKRANYMVRNT